MKKRSLKTLGIALVIGTMSATALVGCGAKTENKPQPTTTVAATYTVTFMKGEETLGTVVATADKALDAEAYSKFEKLDDTEFLGWFEAPSFIEASKKELTSYVFTGDTTLYGSFKSTAANEDTRSWYVVGTSDTGILKDSAWAGAKVEDSIKEQVQLKPTGKATNEFSVDINLYAGDQLQVIHDWAWDGQKGYGCFSDLDTTMFENGGGLGGTDNTANVNVIMDGNYTITLTTDPDDEAHDTVTIVRNGDIQE